MLNLAKLDGNKERFEGRIAEFHKGVDYFDKEESDITIQKFFPEVLLKELYVKRQSAKIRIKDPDDIWVKVGKKFERLDPRVGDIISFNAHVEEIDRDDYNCNPEIYLKNLSDIKIMASSSGQKLSDFLAEYSQK